jgi:hypothetical protein
MNRMNWGEKRSPQQKAELRVCASCEWIFKGAELPCPKCGFATYGARFVYGNKAYAFAITQKPWMEKRVESYKRTLLAEIQKTNLIKKRRKEGILDA